MTFAPSDRTTIRRVARAIRQRGLRGPVLLLLDGVLEDPAAVTALIDELEQP